MNGPTPETIETCRKLVRGYASAVKQSLWDRDGSDSGWTKEHRGPPHEYWCPSVRVDGTQYHCVGPNGFYGQYTRKEAVEQAEGFLAKCREVLAMAGENHGND